MVRIFGILIGLFFSGWLLVSFGMGAVEYISNPPAETAEHEFHKEAKEISFTSDGPLGKFDRQQLQRGFQVYKEVCAACHSLRLVAFRNLEEIGYNEDEVKAIAANWAIQTPDIDPATGEMSTRTPLPADKFPKPFANNVAAAAANNNAIPPDLSLMTKAREGGAPYVYSLLTGYTDPPANLPEANQPGPGLHYNPYFANLNLAMAPPLERRAETGRAVSSWLGGSRLPADRNDPCLSVLPHDLGGREGREEKESCISRFAYPVDN